MPVLSLLSITMPILTLLGWLAPPHDNRSHWLGVHPGPFLALALSGISFGVIALARRERWSATAITGIVFNGIVLILFSFAWALDCMFPRRFGGADWH